MNQERHERKAYWLVVRPHFLTGKDTKRLCPPLWDGRAVGAENPSLSRLYYRGLWGSRNRRALILGWAYYLDAFSSYPLRTWLPSVYRGHDNWYTRGASFPVVRIFTDMSISPSLSPRQCPDRYAFRAGRNLPDKEFRYLRTVIVTAAVHRGFGRRLPCHQVTNFLDLPALGRRQPPYVVLRLRGDLCFWYPLLKVVRAFPGSMAWLLQRRSAWYSDIGSRHFLPPFLPCPEKQADILASASSTPARAGAFPLRRNAPLPMHFTSHSFGRSLSPVHLRRKSARSARGQRSTLSSHCLGAHGFMFYFTPRWGFFSPFPHGTTSLSVTQEYLALQGGPCGFTRDSTCPMLLGSERKLVMLSATGLSPSRVQYSTASPSSTTLVLFLPQPRFHGLGCSHFARRYYGNRFAFFPLATKMFQFARLSLACPWIQQQFERLTYSGISGSMLIFNSPKHFVACYALPRLWVPRYPP
ncbi:hypothetical protein H6P81_021347 [Aristolochia fimbriata]|uniref:Uncharacterized protein n=1 Tax=Aristolochia fimbriata TaxID=158543 RepID=A0AAV7DRQ8_ARIFI|nr:hypothetical protein H6P81_021347 [Aristolochia fimbriata]